MEQKINCENIGSALNDFYTIFMPMHVAHVWKSIILKAPRYQQQTGSAFFYCVDVLDVKRARRYWSLIINDAATLVISGVKQHFASDEFGFDVERSGKWMKTIRDDAPGAKKKRRVFYCRALNCCQLSNTSAEVGRLISIKPVNCFHLFLMSCSVDKQPNKKRKLKQIEELWSTWQSQWSSLV